MTNPQIDIDVELVPNAEKPSGYEFRYSSHSKLVNADGTVDLTSFDKANVRIVYSLLPIDGVQPTFAIDPKHPKQTDEAIWFAEWPKLDPPPAPCPKSSGHANSSFSHFDLPQPEVLEFINKNKDNRRFAYAIRCVVPPGAAVIEDDPIIINKISQR